MEKKLLSKHMLNIRWVDLDAYNHLNNSKYYDFMTECRAIDFSEVHDQCGFVVLENSCKYKKPVSYPAKIHIEHYIQNITTSSFELIYSFIDESNTCCAEGFAKMVCFDLSKNRPVRIPEKVKALFMR
jgi:acyl-CoA thioester hydrolase